MQDILFSAVIDAVGALKEASQGVPNALLRDLASVHPNTAFADLPAPMRAAIQASVRAAFTRLQKEGYTVAEAGSVAPRPPRPTTPAPDARHRPRPGGKGPRPPARRG